MPRISSEDFDLVLTLGDVSEGVLDYVKWMASEIPVYGVYGNHDPMTIPSMQSLDGAVLNIKGWRISGISGCGLGYKYGHDHKDVFHVYSERQVEKKLRTVGAVDILISHAPPLCVSSDEDPTHQGFKAIDQYMETHAPEYVLHGHLHRRYRKMVGKTTVVGVYERDYLKLPPHI